MFSSIYCLFYHSVACSSVLSDVCLQSFYLLYFLTFINSRYCLFYLAFCRSSCYSFIPCLFFNYLVCSFSLSSILSIVLSFYLSVCLFQIYFIKPFKLFSCFPNLSFILHLSNSQVLHFLVVVLPLWIKWPMHFNYTLILRSHTRPEGPFSAGSFSEATLQPKNRPEFSQSSSVC